MNVHFTMKTILLSILFLLSSLPLSAQGPQWITYTTGNSGLPSNTIQSIAVDNYNNIWIGTPRALAKFNGNNWVVYDSSNSPIPNSNSRITVKIDRSGIIWIGTVTKGLIRFDGETFTEYNTSNSPLPTNSIFAVDFENDSTIWIGSGGCIVRKINNNWSVYCDTNSGYSGGAPLDIAIDNGNKWIAPYFNGFVHYVNNSWTHFTQQNSPLPYDWIYDIEIDNQQNKWIGVRFGWLVKYNNSSWTIFNHTNSGIPFNASILKILIDRNENKWLATGGGLVKYNDTVWTVYNDSNSPIASNSLTAISQDSNTNIWIGTFGAGLSVFNENGIVSVQNISNEIPSHFKLHQNFPNPFNPETRITFEIKNRDNVNLSVYDIRGKKVSELVDKQLTPGFYQFEFNGSNLSSGIYYYRISLGRFSETKKMVLIK